MSDGRSTTGIVDRVEHNGVVFVHEVATNKLGYLANTVPVQGTDRLRPGTKLSLSVVDQGNVMVVTSATAIRP